MTDDVQEGDEVMVPWGLDEVRGVVVETYGPPGRPQVVVCLSPEMSGYVVDEATTVTVPRDAVRKAVRKA